MKRIASENGATELIDLAMLTAALNNDALDLDDDDDEGHINVVVCDCSVPRSLELTLFWYQQDQVDDDVASRPDHSNALVCRFTEDLFSHIISTDFPPTIPGT